jgi:hypothetical protein
MCPLYCMYSQWYQIQWSLKKCSQKRPLPINQSTPDYQDTATPHYSYMLVPRVRKMNPSSRPRVHRCSTTVSRVSRVLAHMWRHISTAVNRWTRIPTIKSSPQRAARSSICIWNLMLFISIVYRSIFIVVRSSREGIFVGVDLLGIKWGARCPREVAFAAVVDGTVD